MLSSIALRRGRSTTTPLETKIGYQFQDIRLLTLALTHSSAGRAPNNNERLEFLGDSVLGMLTAETLYRKLPEAREGYLAPLRADLVNTDSLWTAALMLGIDSYLILGGSEEASGGRQKRKILADSIEALIGAIYLDGGLAPTRAFVNRFVIRDRRYVNDDNRSNSH